MDTKKKRLNEALDKLLNGNFDADSLACLKTILKLIDNIVSKPGNSIVRRIRLSNAAINSKIVARKGGIDILYAIGFVSKEEDRKLLSSEPGETFLVLEEAQEDTDWIVTARNTLTRIAIVQLKCKPEELPKSKEPVKLPPTSSSLSSTSNNFNLYQGHRFDGQAASVDEEFPSLFFITTLSGIQIKNKSSSGGGKPSKLHTSLRSSKDLRSAMPSRT